MKSQPCGTLPPEALAPSIPTSHHLWPAHSTCLPGLCTLTRPPDLLPLFKHAPGEPVPQTTLSVCGLIFHSLYMQGRALFCPLNTSYLPRLKRASRLSFFCAEGKPSWDYLPHLPFLQGQLTENPKQEEALLCFPPSACTA